MLPLINTCIHIYVATYKYLYTNIYMLPLINTCIHIYMLPLTNTCIHIYVATWVLDLLDFEEIKPEA